MRSMDDKKLTPDVMREWIKVARKHLIKNDPDAKDYMSGEAWTDTVIDKNLFKDLHYYIRNPDAKPDLDEVFMARIQGEASPDTDLPKPKPVKAKPAPVAPIDGIEPLPGRLSEVRARPYLKEMQAGTEFMHPQGIVGSDGKKYYLDGEPVTRREMLDLLMSKDDWGGVNESPSLEPDLSDADVARLKAGKKVLPRTVTDAEFNKKFVRAEERRIKKHIDVIKAALLKDDPFIDKEMLNAELKLREQSLDDLSKGKYFDSLLGEDADAFVKNRIDEMNVFTAVSPAKFDAVLKTGRFKNIHEVTDDDLALGGEGGLAYDDPASRAHAERKLFGVDDGAKDATAVAEDPDKFPVYGFMSKGDEVSPHSRINGFGYGDIMVRFRNDTSRDRTTVTIGDSLNNSIGDTVGVGTSKRAVPVSNPSRELLYGADDAIDDKEKLRLMKQVLKKDTDEWTADLIYKDGDVEEMVSTKDFYYLETQMYGEVSTRDIAEVFVTSKVDAINIRKQLDDAGLQHVKISARKYDDRFRFGYSNNKQSLIYKRTMSLSDDDIAKLGDSYLPTIFNAYVRTMDDDRLAVTWDIDDLPVGKEIFTKRGVESLKIRSDSNEKYPTLTDRYMSDKRLTPDTMREWLKVARKHLIKNDPDAKDYMSGEAWTDTVIDKNLFKDLHYYIRNPDAKPDLDEVFMARIQGEASPDTDLPKPKPVKAKPAPVAPIDGIEPLPGRLSEVRARPYLKEMQAGTEFMHPQGIVGSDGKKYYLDGEPVTRREMLDLLMSKDDWGGVNESPSLEPDLSDADVARLKAGKKVLPRTVTDAKFNAQFVKNIIDDNERIISRSNPTSGNSDEERAAKLMKIKRLKQTNIDLKKGKYLDDLLGEDVDAFVKNRVDEMNNFMAISPAKLDAVLKGGKFKNRHQVTDEDLALSDGEGLKPDGKRHRASVERRLFGVDDGAKDATAVAEDPDKFPVYGFMSKGDEVSPHSRINGFGYGDIMVRFRNDTTRDRTTVTIGDSLHNAQGGAKLTQAHAVPVTNPTRALLYGIEDHIEGDLLKKTLKKDTDEWTSEYKLNDKGELENTSYMYYFETQMYGEVSIRDIAEISVTSKVDAVKIRKQLDDAGLQHVKISARKYDDRLSFERKQVESDDPFGGGNFDRKDPKHIRAMSLSDDDIAKLGDSYLPTIFNAYMRTFNGEFWYERATLPKDLPAGKSVLTKHGVKNLKINYVVNKKHPSITDMVMEDAKLTPDVMREWIKVARKNSEAKEAATGEPWLDTVLDKNLLKDLHYYIRNPEAKPDVDEAFMASVRGDAPTAKPTPKPAKPEPVTPPKAVDPPAPPAPAPVSPTGGATPLPGRLSEIKARPYLKEMQGGTAFAHPKGVLTSDGKKYYLDGAQINRKRVIELMISRDEWADVPPPKPVKPSKETVDARAFETEFDAANDRFDFEGLFNQAKYKNLRLGMFEDSPSYLHDWTLSRGLTEYAGSKYTDINAYLRAKGSGDKDLDATIASIDSDFSKVKPFDKDETLFRGLTVDITEADAFKAKYTKGAEIVTDQYWSTSSRPKETMNFLANPTIKKSFKVFFEVDVPEGSEVLKFNSFQYESLIKYGRGWRWLMRSLTYAGIAVTARPCLVMVTKSLALFAYV